MVASTAGKAAAHLRSPACIVLRRGLERSNDTAIRHDILANLSALQLLLRICDDDGRRRTHARLAE
jgi:hypothetical protein